MTKNKICFELNKDNKTSIEIEVNDWAERANISLLTRCLDSLVLTTIVIGEKEKPTDFVRLTVDYDEKYYAAGKIYGSRFVRRESKPSETAILNARLVDRGLRPALKYFPYEIQIVNTILSLDPEFDPDILAFFGSSIGFDLLGYEWLGPVIPVKISKIDGKIVLYPRENERIFSDYTIFISGIENKINMIEFEGQEIPEDEILKICQLAINKINELRNHLLKEIKKPQSIKIDLIDYLPYGEKFLEKYHLDIEKLLFTDKERENLNELFEILEEKKEEIENFDYVYQGVIEKIKKIFQTKILKDKIRPDGRKLDEIRKIDLEIGILPRAHGSAIFKRGLTHILSTVTLGSLSEELWVREIEFEGIKRFLHHYNFPPFSTGEIGPIKVPSRREIGHGNLVEKALKNLIPNESVFPYTIRLVSDILSSNGSTSMGSVCASTLALLDAGVPIKNKCAGISIGIIYQDDNNYELLTDIQGPEDFWGGMDFKVAGTDKGITAIQLDVKIDGLNLEIISKALEKAKNARLFILDKMTNLISKPRSELKENVPRSAIVQIDNNKIGLLIGPGGKVINEIISLTNSKIDIKPDGTVYLTAPDQKSIEKTINLIKLAINDLVEGEILEGKIIKILNFGLIIDLGLNRTALLHISEIPKNQLTKFNIDQNLLVQIKQITDQGKIYLSLKNAE